MSEEPTVTSAVAKVACMSTEWDVTQPQFSYETDGTVSGTVFFVRGSDIGLNSHNYVGITNFHVVEDCRRTSCRVYLSDGAFHDCAVLVACPQLDFAILQLDFEPPGCVTLADSGHPAPGTPMMITGYPLDTTCDSCQFSYGHMSAPISGHWLQCSLSANCGNSGGPLIELSSGHVHGICTAAPCMSEGITYALPFWAVRVSLERWRQGGRTLLKLPTVHSRVHKLSCTEAKLQGIPHVGVVLEKPSPSCMLSGLQPGDVLCGLNESTICAHTQRLKSSQAGEVDLDSPVLSLLLPEKCVAHVRRNGITGVLSISMRQTAAPVPSIRELYPMWESVPIENIGGAVCLPFCKNVLDGFDGYDDSEHLRACWNAWDKRANYPAGRIVVVYVQGHTNAEDHGIEPLMLLESINSAPVRNMSELRAAMAKLKCVRGSMPVHFKFNGRQITMLASHIQEDQTLMPVSMTCQ